MFEVWEVVQILVLGIMVGALSVSWLHVAGEEEVPTTFRRSTATGCTLSGNALQSMSVERIKSPISAS